MRAEQQQQQQGGVFRVADYEGMATKAGWTVALQGPKARLAGRYRLPRAAACAAARRYVSNLSLKFNVIRVGAARRCVPSVCTQASESYTPSHRISAGPKARMGGKYRLPCAAACAAARRCVLTLKHSDLKGSRASRHARAGTGVLAQPPLLLPADVSAATYAGVDSDPMYRALVVAWMAASVRWRLHCHCPGCVQSLPCSCCLWAKEPWFAMRPGLKTTRLSPSQHRAGDSGS